MISLSKIEITSFIAGAHAIKKIKIFRSCSRFKTIPQLFSTIEIVSVVVTIEQQTIFRSDLLFLFNNLYIFLMNSNSTVLFEFKKIFFRVQGRLRQNDRVLSSSKPCFAGWLLDSMISHDPFAVTLLLYCNRDRSNKLPKLESCSLHFSELERCFVFFFGSRLSGFSKYGIVWNSMV